MLVVVVMSVVMAVSMVTPVIVVMVVIVVMSVIVFMIVAIRMILVRVGVELFRGHRLVGDFGELDDVVDHLVLEDRRAELGQELRVAAVVIVDLALLPGKLSHTLEQRAAHLVVSDVDLIARADL